jgi:iron complex transport system permease protein
LVRSVLSTGYRWLIVLASLMGAVLLMAADVLARWLIAPQELPVGVVTAVLGGAYLLWLVHLNTMAQGAA